MSLSKKYIKLILIIIVACLLFNYIAIIGFYFSRVESLYIYLNGYIEDNNGQFPINEHSLSLTEGNLPTYISWFNIEYGIHSDEITNRGNKLYDTNDERVFLIEGRYRSVWWVNLAKPWFRLLDNHYSIKLHDEMLRYQKDKPAEVQKTESGNGQ